MSAVAGGIDLGGTKIEAATFDSDLNFVKRHRIPTPRSDYNGFLESLSSQVQFLIEHSKNAYLPIGISHPGLYLAHQNHMTAVNLPVGKNDIVQDLQNKFSRPFIWENDCKCFALSESKSGAADSTLSGIGLIIGTGLAAGYISEHRIPPSLNQGAYEIGHIGASVGAISRHSLPLFSCNCGRQGCWEAYVSGTGVRNLTHFFLNEGIDMPDLINLSVQGDLRAQAVFNVWADLTAELILTLQMSHDPEIVVLGGGLSLIEDLPRILHSKLQPKIFDGWQSPQISKAIFSDSSGVRGAAILAFNETKN